MKKLQVLAGVLFLFALITCTMLPAQAIFTAVTNTDKVKLLSEPTASAAVVKVLKLGDVVKVYKKSSDGQFWEVEHKGSHGWIMLHFLSPKDHRNNFHF
ncbi:SH3 domain-containing protein [Sporomusa sphaeroides]|uniref:SH3 domain-containing protein n=1 Tax=Sporomusa sphaeroides TaxID=47679 RepID=UPI003DA0EC2E